MAADFGPEIVISCSAHDLHLGYVLLMVCFGGCCFTSRSPVQDQRSRREVEERIYLKLHMLLNLDLLLHGRLEYSRLVTVLA